MRSGGILIFSLTFLFACSVKNQELAVHTCYDEFLCTADGTIIRWQSNAVEFKFQDDAPENLKVAIEKSAQDYNEYFEFTDLIIDPANTQAPPYKPNYSELNQDGVNAIYYVRGSWPWEQKIKNSLAVTLTRYNAYGIIEADIFVKANAEKFEDPDSDKYLPWSTYISTHELGHALGRAHSRNPSSFMNPTIYESAVINMAAEDGFKNFFSIYDLDVISLAYDLVDYEEDSSVIASE